MCIRDSVNPMKERRIWVQVAKNFEPFIRLTEEDVRQEFFDFDESFTFKASELGTGNHKISAQAFASWQKHSYTEKGEAKKEYNKAINIYTRLFEENREDNWYIIYLRGICYERIDSFLGNH